MSSCNKVVSILFVLWTGKIFWMALLSINFYTLPSYGAAMNFADLPLFTRHVHLKTRNTSSWIWNLDPDSNLTKYSVLFFFLKIQELERRVCIHKKKMLALNMQLDHWHINQEQRKRFSKYSCISLYNP